MEVVRWNPFNDLRTIQEEVNRLFEQRNSPSQSAMSRENVSTRVWSPAVDVTEDADEITLHVELPGVSQDDLRIELAGESLTLSGERPLPDEANRAKYVRVERPYGPFQRVFTIGAPLQHDNETARYTDGVLEVRLPKAEAVKPKRVEVKVGSAGESTGETNGASAPQS